MSGLIKKLVYKLVTHFGLGKGGEVVNRITIDAWKDSVEEIRKKQQIKGEKHLRLKHISTSIDGERFIKKHGLLDLNSLLKMCGSPLTLFLLDNGIHVDVDDMVLKFNGKAHSIEEDSRANYLWNKLVKCGGQREFFAWTKTNQEMENYSCVRDCPEILSSFQVYIEEYFFENVELNKKWTDLKPIRLTYEVDIPLQTITDSFGKRIDEKDIIDTIIEKKESNTGYLCFAVDNSHPITYKKLVKTYEQPTNN